MSDSSVGPESRREASILERIDASGYAVVEGVLRGPEIDALIAMLGKDITLSGGGRRGGARNLLESPEIHALAWGSAIRRLVEPVLGAGAFPVRGILFDKSGVANWLVPWHQDVTIAVRRRIDAAGFGPWSIKQGVPHVQPPAAILAKMISVRIHLDDCPAENGALRVLPGSHLAGKLKTQEVEFAVQTQRHAVCEVSAGGALLMRPLLLHASSAAHVPRHRRVIHLDFAAAALPGGLQWHQSNTG